MEDAARLGKKKLDEGPLVGARGHVVYVAGDYIENLVEGDLIEQQVKNEINASGAAQVQGSSFMTTSGGSGNKRAPSADIRTSGTSNASKIAVHAGDLNISADVASNVSDITVGAPPATPAETATPLGEAKKEIWKSPVQIVVTVVAGLITAALIALIAHLFR